MYFFERDLKNLFLLTGVYLLFLPPLFSHFTITLFSSIVVGAVLTTSFNKLLWISMGAGLISDLFITELPFGLMPLFYMGAATLLFYWKRYIFIDSFFSLPLFVGLFSLILIFEEWIFMRTSADVWLQTEFILHPIKDALFALVGFSLPYFLFRSKEGRRTPKLFSYKK